MILVVTGFVPIPDHPRSVEEYRVLGEKLFDAGIPLLKLEGELEQCWLYQHLLTRNGKFTHSIADNPRKNSVAYHCVQAQKSEFLVDALNYVPVPPDVLIWIDWGIFHIPGVTAQIIRDFVERAENERVVTIPGCWRSDYEYRDEWPCWRFAGGVWIVPRQYVISLDGALKTEYRHWLWKTGNVSWDVNMLAKVEERHPDLIWWYGPCDHDASLFTNYKRGVDADGRQALRGQQGRYC